MKLKPGLGTLTPPGQETELVYSTAPDPHGALIPVCITMVYNTKQNNHHTDVICCRGRSQCWMQMCGIWSMLLTKYKYNKYKVFNKIITQYTCKLCIPNCPTKTGAACPGTMTG